MRCLLIVAFLTTGCTIDWMDIGTTPLAQEQCDPEHEDCPEVEEPDEDPSP